MYNINSEPNSLDVRGLRVSEAIKKTEKKLHEMQSKGSGPLRVVVGTVPRTEGKISALKLALMQAMEKWVVLSMFNILHLTNVQQTKIAYSCRSRKPKRARNHYLLT